MAETIPIPTITEGNEFYCDDKGNLSLATALENCQKGDFGNGPTEEYEPQFMPSILDARICSPKTPRIFQTWFCVPSIRATGRTKQGNAVVVYAHIPNHFSNPENIKNAVAQGLANGAGIMPQDKFQTLIDLNELTDNQGNRLVWVVDYGTLKNSPKRILSLKTDSDLEQVLKHPQTIPFCASRARAEKYLVKHKEVYGDRIGNWHTDDLSSEPLARLLFVGGYCDNGFLGDSNLYNKGRFVGVKKSGEATSQNFLLPK